MQLKVFYSWQSDHPPKLGKEFIRVALEAAAARIKAARGIEVIVDSDTQGIPGTPPVNATILKKIEACDVFVGDVSIVAQTAEGKLVPNPNVMAEYGYALMAKGWERILLAMNTAFGPPKDLPFDLNHHRFPADYELANEKPDKARRDARDKLSARLELGLNVIADDIIATRPPPPDLLPPLHALAIQTLNSRFANNPPAIVSEPAAWLCIAPATALGATNLDLKAVQAVRHLLFPTNEVTTLTGQDHTQWWAKAPARAIPDKPNPESDWFARLLRPGVVEQVFTLGRRIDDDPTIVVNGFHIEKRLVTLADRSIALLTALGLAGPFAVVTHLYGLEEVELSGAPGSGRFRVQSLALTAALVPEGGRAGAFLRPAFDQLWLASGVAQGSLSYDGSEDWKGYASDNAY